MTLCWILEANRGLNCATIRELQNKENELATANWQEQIINSLQSRIITTIREIKHASQNR